ncbi:MAG TPA: GrpB family protein [Capsulimonadaceae bacterium]|nr:GrpB family protein [Capsulimonadaceae bacterium]
MQTPSPARKIEIVSYQDRWPDEFRETGAKLRRALGDVAARIDHIGSTSVSGLCAKDIVDIQVAVRSLDPDDEFVSSMEEAGFRFLPQFSKDHRPPGDDRPESEWQKRYFRESIGNKETHIHFRVEGAANQRYALLFRDYLRANRPAMLAYEQIKRELARLHPNDVDAYYDIKDPVCDLIMNAAEAWATATDSCPGRSDA